MMEGDEVKTLFENGGPSPQPDLEGSAAEPPAKLIKVSAEGGLEQDGTGIPATGVEGYSSPTSHEMDLESLEDLLGVQLMSCGKREIISEDKWRVVNERLGRGGATRLMLAARCGAVDCMDLLLRCGANVDARDRIGRLAIDHSVIGNHPEATLLLLRSDSILPSSEGGEEQYRRLQNMVSQHECLEKFFSERDGFHKMLIEGGPDDVKNILSQSDETRRTYRRWVNSEGHSALYTAAEGSKCNMWALLRTKDFIYATEEEREGMETRECDNDFHCAIGDHFVKLSGCHIHKMVSMCQYLNKAGVDEEACGGIVDGYFRAIDRHKYTSVLLKCLQDHPFLEIILDFTRTDIEGIYPSGKCGKIYGITDFDTDRIYVAAKETEEFDYSDVVSNLVHELTHKTLAVVFKNQGLPYRKEETDAEEEYEKILMKVSLNQDRKSYDNIIIRALKNPSTLSDELIVRVPEIISKYSVNVDGRYQEDDGIRRLEVQTPRLLEFFVERVLPEMKTYVQKNKTGGRVTKWGLLNNFALLTSHYNERIQSSRCDRASPTSTHREFEFMSVSNLKLGVSHLKASLKDVTFVDWTKYQSNKKYFCRAVTRREIKRLAIVWDKEGSPVVCKGLKWCTDSRCIGKELDKVGNRPIILVHKAFSVGPGEKCIDYTWSDLSGQTKEHILEKILMFGGLRIKLKDLLGCVSGEEAVESMLGDLLNADDISHLIDVDRIFVGRRLSSDLKERAFELLRSHPKSYIARSLQLRQLDFNKELFEKRSTDVFVMVNADKSDLKKCGFNNVHVWDGSIPPDGIRCFVHGSCLDKINVEELFGEISGKLRDTSPPETNGGKWDIIHFFEFNNDKYIHLLSFNSRLVSKSSQYSAFSLLMCDGDRNEAIIIADDPGSGKSLLVNKTAGLVRKRCRKCLVDLVELPLFQNILKGWKKAYFTSEGKATDCLYALIKQGDSGFERKIMDLFLNTKNKSVIFFDGFDEICPDYKEIVTSFIKALVNGTNVKVVVTTRTHECVDLEENLATIAYKTVPFDRSEQVELINLEWNASLLSIPTEVREAKINSLISGLECYNDTKASKGTSELIQNMKLTLRESTCPMIKALQFDELAEELMGLGKSIGEGEGEFSKTPLHTWMLAYVAFADNFRFRKFDYLSELYKQFVDIKINLYCREKAKVSESVATDAMISGTKSSAYLHLKKYSAFFFLEDKKYALKDNESHDMCRIGLVAMRKNLVVFVHQTFAEYLFSLWFLDNVKEGVPNVDLLRVFLDPKFAKVRQFIDSQFLSEYERRSNACDDENMESDVRLIMKSSVFSSREEFVTTIQKCLYQSILERNKGILRQLTDCSQICIADVIFGRLDWQLISPYVYINSTNIRRNWRKNALTFLFACADSAVQTIEFHDPCPGVKYLKFLPTLLRHIEEQALITNLSECILEEGLWWMGLEDIFFWRDEDAREQIGLILQFLVKHKGALGEILKVRMLGECNALLEYSSQNGFDWFVYLLESLFDGGDLKTLILEGAAFLNSWIAMVKCCAMEQVDEMWRYVVGKLGTKGERRKFLKRKDGDNSNALFAAFVNAYAPGVVPYVWGLLRKEFALRECRKILFTTFNGVDNFLLLSYGYGIFKWLSELLEDEFIDGDEATTLLLSRNIQNDCYLLKFIPHQPPSSIYKLQGLLLAGRVGSEDILRNMSGHYNSLASMCLLHCEWKDKDADFIANSQRDYLQLQPFLQSHPFVDGVQLDDDGFLPGVLKKRKQKIPGFLLKAYLVLLERQFHLEIENLGRMELIDRIKEDWVFIYRYNPWLIMEEDGRKTGSFPIPYFFAVLSKFLSKKEVAQILLHKSDYFGTPFHQALSNDMGEQGGLRSFLALYDVARWCLSEDSLWRVHGIGRMGVNKEVLRFLLAAEGTS